MSSSAQVWVIDDDRSIRWVLERALTQAGMSVTVFENGAEAMARLGTEQPDAVVSDIRMPEMDGLSLLEGISARHPQLPGDHHDSLLGLGEHGLGLSWRSVRVSAETLRCRRGGGAGAPRAGAQQGQAGLDCTGGKHRQRTRWHRRCSPCHAGSISRHRTLVALQYHSAHYRRVRYRKGTGGRAPCTVTARV